MPHYFIIAFSLWLYASDLIRRHKNQQFDYIVISVFYSIKFAIWIIRDKIHNIGISLMEPQLQLSLAQIERISSPIEFAWQIRIITSLMDLKEVRVRVCVWVWEQ